MRLVGRILVALAAISTTIMFTRAYALDYTPQRDSATGQVISLTLQGYESRAGATRTTMSLEAVAATARAFVIANAGLLGVSADPRDLHGFPPEVDRLGLGHQRFALRHAGLPVFGGEVYVHVDGASGVFYATTKPMGKPPATTLPLVTAMEARQAVIAWATNRAPAGSVLNAGAPTLLIMSRQYSAQYPSEKALLAWKVRVTADEFTDFDEDCFLDAQTLELILHYSNIRSINRLIFDCAWNPPQTNCAMNYYDIQYNYYFGRSETASPRGPYPRSDWPHLFGSTDVDTLHTLIGLAHSYVWTTFGRNGGNGYGGLGSAHSDSYIPLGESRGFVHVQYADVGILFARYLYDGRIGFSRGMVTPDVVGHEFAHCEVFSSFVDSTGAFTGPVHSGQPSTLDESYSDIEGAALERCDYGVLDWQIGAWQDVPAGTYPSSIAGTIRNLQNPPSVTYLGDDHVTEVPYPDRFYAAGVYCGEEDDGGEHFNSTIPSYACYLASEGGDFNGCHIAAIGFSAVEQIYYRAWTTYFTRTVTFNEAYFGFLQAAADLYPQEVVDQFRIALQATEMDQPGLCSGIPAVFPACAGLTAVFDDLVPPTEGSFIRFCGPNPSYGPTLIDYALGRPGEVVVAVYDVAGRQVAMVNSEVQAPGIHRANWMGRTVPSGVYFVRVSVDGGTIGTKKLLVIR